MFRNFPGGPVGKNLISNAGDVGLIPDWATKPECWNYCAHALQLEKTQHCNETQHRIKKKMFIHLAKGERWYKCFGDLPRVPGPQEVAQQSANKGAHDCPSCTLHPGSGSTAGSYGPWCVPICHSQGRPEIQTNVHSITHSTG